MDEKPAKTTPLFLMICGPNGAGKSTYTKQSGIGGSIPVIDPDRIAAKEHVSPFKAGVLAVNRIRDFLASGQSFARETTLSGKNELRLMEEAKERGFSVSLVFIGINSAKQSVDRVQERKIRGGHDVPEEDILRRYDRCLNNLPRAIMLADNAKLINNAGTGYEDVAKFVKGQLVAEQSKPLWYARVQEIAKEQGIRFENWQNRA